MAKYPLLHFLHISPTGHQTRWVLKFWVQFSPLEAAILLNLREVLYLVAIYHKNQGRDLNPCSLHQGFPGGLPSKSNSLHRSLDISYKGGIGLLSITTCLHYLPSHFYAQSKRIKLASPQAARLSIFL